MPDLVDSLTRLGDWMPRWVTTTTLACALLLAAAALLDRALCRRVGAGWRVPLYLLVLLRLAWPAGWASSVGLLPADLLATSGGLDHGEEPAVTAPAPALPLPDREAPRPAVERPLSFAKAGPASVRATALLAADSVASDPSMPPAGRPPLAFWLGALYAGIALSLALRWTVARVRLARALRATIPARESLALLAPDVAVREHARLGPLVVGAWRPWIVLPTPLVETLETPALAAILAHERAHVTRRDALLVSALHLVCALAWPVLPVWIAAWRVRTLIEQACDERALAGASPSDRRRYGELLLALAEGRWPLITEALVPSFGRELRRRLRALAFRRRWPVAVQALVALPPVLALLVVSGHAADAGPGPARGAETGFGDLPLVDDLPADFDEMIRQYTGRMVRVDGPGLDPATVFRALAGLTPESEAIVRRYYSTIRKQRQDAWWTMADSLSKPPRSSRLNVLACHGAYGRGGGPASGAVLVRFTVRPDGGVGDAAVERSAAERTTIEACVLRAVSSVRFPPPRGGKPVTVRVLANNTDQERVQVEGLGIAAGPMKSAVRARMQDLKACGARERALDPAYPREHRATFTIGPAGRVTQVALIAGRPRDERLRQCLQVVLSGIDFGQPTDGNPVRVTWPMAFYDDELRLADRATKAAEPPSPPVMPNGLEHRYKRELEEIRVEGSGLDRRIIGAAMSIVYRRGARTPSPCREHHVSGAVLVRFTIGPSGNVTAAAPVRSTLDSPDADRCLAEYVRGLEFPRPSDGKPVVVTWPLNHSVSGQIDIRGFGLGRKAIGETMRTRSAAFQACHERALDANPYLSGTLELAFTITPEGQIADVGFRQSEQERDPRAACLRAAVADLRFPAPSDSKTVLVSYPLSFAPLK